MRRVGEWEGEWREVGEGRVEGGWEWVDGRGETAGESERGS